MKLSDGTVVNTNIKFLGPVRLVTDRQENVTGAYFIFNAHKLYFDTIEAAETIRAEIAEKVPEADILTNPEKARQWEVPADMVKLEEIDRRLIEQFSKEQ